MTNIQLGDLVKISHNSIGLSSLSFKEAVEVYNEVYTVTALSSIEISDAPNSSLCELMDSKGQQFPYIILNHDLILYKSNTQVHKPTTITIPSIDI
jgi:hypothetical protein